MSLSFHFRKIVRRGTLPNFIVLGTEKSGTTSVYYYLDQHPDVFMSPIKETNFFVFDGPIPDAIKWPKPQRFRVRTFDAYRQLFQRISTEKAIGEASPSYLYTPSVAERIHRRLPNAKMIVILRDPADRAYSGYTMRLRNATETRSFSQAIRDEDAGVYEPGWEYAKAHYVGLGFYARQLKPYLKLFGRSQVAIYLFEDLKADGPGFMREVFRFLEVDDTFATDTSLRHNASGVPRSRLFGPVLRETPLSRAVKKLLPPALRKRAMVVQERLRGRLLRKETLPAEIRAGLVAGYRDDVLELQEMIQRDLSHWLV